MSLEPERAGALEHGHQLAAEVKGHDPVGAADELAADKDGGDGRAPTAEHLEQRALHLLAPGSLSSSCTSAFTLRSCISFATVWHMQQELSVNTTTARSDASFITRSAICYA